MKQTAVEFLLINLLNKFPKEMEYLFLLDKNLIEDILKEAKKMEEEQIVQAFNLGQQEEAKQEFWTKGAKYYEETFNK
jgi:hypothetical protein